MNLLRKLKKIYWYLDSWLASKRYPLNQSLPYLGITGTDGKTTTCHYLYEIAKEHGYTPLLITTVGAKFQDEYIDFEMKSGSFLAYSIKTFLSNLKQKNYLKAIKALLLHDKEGYEKTYKETHRTTPLASEIRKLIIEYEEKGANLFILECTSHALDQYRVHNIQFDAIGFTNITNEHLDYHGNWENYALAKSKLIGLLKEGGAIALNKNDNKSYTFLKEILDRKYKYNNYRLLEYGIEDIEKIKLENFIIEVQEKGNIQQITAKSVNNVCKDCKQYQTSVRLLGQYNLFNALAAFSIFYGFNDSNPEACARGIKNLKNIPGRMQVIHQKPQVIIDFAHTSNGMENVLKSVKTKGRLWVIFGCTGERDKSKRPVMGKIAFNYADNILITADDSRRESLFEINNQIIQGFKNQDVDFVIHSYYDGLEYDNTQQKFIVRFDEPNENCRINAIHFAIKNADADDTVLILGKGHEKTIDIGGKDIEWSDEKVALKALEKYWNLK
ncbi:MAG: UDP-N-acetylmuramoyl-L-alanyl-D-glutamate--2,6-diaminopimelate ligase [Candidatus Dojkabacteria bacterium]|nr:MAG: UDP-N-acetylmuramoyl-L-alanyl-D-glutamate--2,6-diaminopimelate ligase [Candidatus Dojkabacteria bacterium]